MPTDDSEIIDNGSNGGWCAVAKWERRQTPTSRNLQSNWLNTVADALNCLGVAH